MNDYELDIAIRRFLQGEGQHFDTIYEATKTSVYYTVLSIVKNTAEAEDIMQDTYLKMVESLPHYRGTRAFKAWLLKIAKNLSLNAIKRKKRESSVDVLEHEQLFGQHEPEQEKQSVLCELMRELTEDEKQVVIRRAVLNHKHKDIAKALNKPLGTVTWMYQNALAKMRKKAGEDDAQ